MFVSLPTIVQVLLVTNSTLSHLSFEEGDILDCGRTNGFSRHVLLATNSTHVIHVIGDIFNKASIKEEPLSAYISRLVGKRGKRIDCNIYSPASLSSPDAVQRARQDIARYELQSNIYHDNGKCNSEHWVRYWAEGKPVSYHARRDFKLNTGEPSIECMAGKPNDNQS